MDCVQDFIRFVEASTSSYQTVETGKNILLQHGFTELSWRARWELCDEGKYFVSPFPTCLFAFSSGKDIETTHIAAAHTDSPCLHVKPKAELSSNGYLRVNVEIYGGPILNTWLDRPLTLAGRVCLKSDDIYHPKQQLLDFGRPVLVIPNQAIHYNKNVNKGVELSKQNDMLPLLGLFDEQWNENDYFLKFLSRELSCDLGEILDFDLYVVNSDTPCRLGVQQDLLSSPRLDNLTSCYALIQGICRAEVPNHRLNVIALYDNEEIGSKTKQGADSSLLMGILNRIGTSLGTDRLLQEGLADSMCLSVDVAHAIHPAAPEKFDPVNRLVLGDGVAIKMSSNQRYTYDTEAIAILQQLCEQNGIAYKKFVNHSDQTGGTTIGPYLSSWLPMKTVDIGVPLLAMHSSRELMSLKDQEALEQLTKVFFS